MTQLVCRCCRRREAGLAGAVHGSRRRGRERATDVRWEVRSRVAAAFYGVYHSERAITIAEATRRLMEDVAATADAMYRVGETAQADVLKARVEVGRMTEEVIAMRSMRLMNLARLSGLLDQPVDSITPPALLPVLPDSLPALDSLMRQAVAARPMVRAGGADLRAAEDASPRARWLTSVGVQYGQRGGMGVERMGGLMLGASIPVFAGSRQFRMREEPTDARNGCHRPRACVPSRVLALARCMSNGGVPATCARCTALRSSRRPARRSRHPSPPIAWGA